MITLYRVAECAACDDVQQTLRELVVAHKVVEVDQEKPRELQAVLAGRDFPVIADGDEIVSGDEVPGYLVELTREMEQWRKFQTDACYIDDRGKTC